MFGAGNNNSSILPVLPHTATHPKVLVNNFGETDIQPEDVKLDLDNILDT